MLKTITGIITKEIPYGETSKIIQVLTSDGIIGIMCKGAKTLKSPFRVSTLKFTYGNFNIYYKENKLSLLHSADIINPLNTIKNDIILLSYLNYLTELTEQVIKQTSENIWDLFLATILKIEAGFDPLIMSNILELKYLDFLGVGLNLDSCVSCGAKVNIVTIDGDRGGYICQKCYQNEIIVDSKTIELIRLYYYVDIKSIKNLKIKDKNKQEINYFINTYYDRYTGLYLKSKNFLKKLVD